MLPSSALFTVDSLPLELLMAAAKSFIVESLGRLPFDIHFLSRNIGKIRGGGEQVVFNLNKIDRPLASNFANLCWKKHSLSELVWLHQK